MANNVKGSKQNDVLPGTPDKDHIHGKQGDDYVVGLSGNDKLKGDDGDDWLEGGLGNDAIDGGKGFDTAIFNGSFASYSINVVNGKSGHAIVSGADGTDTVKNVEALQFDDFYLLLGQNNAALAQNDSASTSEDASVIINVLANDVDFEGNALQVTKIDGQNVVVGQTVVLTSGATVTLNANQTLTYDPGLSFQSLLGNESAPDSFTYVVKDSQGAVSAAATVNVTVEGEWDVTYAVNAEVDESAQKPATEDILNGTGIPATDFGLAQELDAGIELGLQVIYRQGPTVASTDPNGYSDGVLSFTVNDGPQSTANGSSVNNVNRASWNFEYSIATGLNGAGTDLDDYTFKLQYDVDPGVATSFRTMVLEAEGTPQAPGQSGYRWRDTDPGAFDIGKPGGVGVYIDDDAGTATVTQNSQNYAFHPQLHLTSPYNAGSGFTGPATFDLILQAYDGADLIAQNHIQVNVVVV